MTLLRRFVTVAVCAVALFGARPAWTADSRPIAIEVDAREAPRRIFHAHLTVPAAPGPLTLLYPKWIPGEHMPSGPIADLAGLQIKAGGKTIAWTRDPSEMFAFHCDVPAGVDVVDVMLDYLSPAEAAGFSSGPSATAKLTVISWNQLAVYPKDSQPDSVMYAASLRLPAGWKHATALPSAQSSGETLQFSPVSLTTLVDSPVLAGEHMRTIPLTTTEPIHRLNLAADSEAALAISPQQIESYKNLVAETGALFGARHYEHYDFLLTLSDHTAHFGLEHHESSDDRVAERTLVDEDKRKASAGLLSHEMTHSWNGKYRRPAGLAPGHFDRPMDGSLLWVYEGLTDYLGAVLTPRSGLLTAEHFREDLALTAATMELQGGRTWRPLQDTATAAQLLYGARSDWASWRRGVDYYPEGDLLWLEADTIIRRETKGQKSLDDFCRSFHGGRSGAPTVVPYTFDDVVSGLNQIAPYDWNGFWTSRLTSTAADAPLGGVTASGWKLVYRDTPTDMFSARERVGKVVDVRFSIGITVADEGSIPDVIPDSPAAKAGLSPGVKLVAVNGRRWSRDVLHDAIKASATRPIQLLTENGEFFQSQTLTYTGGERYPHLERDGASADVLSRIIAPLGGRR